MGLSVLSLVERPPFRPGFLGAFVPVAQPGWGSRDKCPPPLVPVVLRPGTDGACTWPLALAPWPGPFVPVVNNNRDECPSAPAAFSPFLCRGRKFLFFSFSCFSFGVWFVVFHLFFSISTLYVIHHHALLLYSILLEYTSNGDRIRI